MSTYKKITKIRLAQLLRAEYKMDLLNSYGVDNWEGYGEALSDIYNPDGLPYNQYRSLSDEEITKDYEDID